MPLIYNEPNTYEKNHIKYVKIEKDIHEELDKTAFKKFKDEEREKRNQQRNEHQKQQFDYYIGLYEKYGTKDWEFIQMKLDEEKRQNELIRKANQKIRDDAISRLNHFGPQRKKDMYPYGSFKDIK